MRNMLLCAVLAAALLLTGCAAPFASGTVEELLRAPQPTQQLSAVQKALHSYLGENLQLKYPRGGQEMSPIVLADLDGDGVSEAVVLYVVESKGQNVHLAVMEQSAAGWEVTYEIEGMSTEVASLELSQLRHSGLQLVVGYANATLTDKYLSVYDYRNDTVTRLLEQAYAYYLADDVDNNGVQDLFLAANGAEAGALTLQWLAEREGEFAPVQTISLDERFVACQKLYTANSGGVSGLIAEGTFATGLLANQVFRLTPDGQLARWPQGETDVPVLTLRSLTNLTASEIKGSHGLRVPTNVTPADPTLSYSRRFYWVTWQDYLAETVVLVPPGKEESGIVQPEANTGLEASTPQPCFGVYDSLHGYFVRLPEEWRGKITIVDGIIKGDWQVRLREGNSLLLGVRVTESDVPSGTYVRAATMGGNSVLMYFGGQCTAEQGLFIRTGVTVLQ